MSGNHPSGRFCPSFHHLKPLIKGDPGSQRFPWWCPWGLLGLFNFSASYTKQLGCGHSVQWVECKTILIALVRTPFDEPDYNSPDSWAVANDLAICYAIWETRGWQIKDTALWGQETWKHIMAANQTIWVTPVTAHSKGLCSAETVWNQVCD